MTIIYGVTHQESTVENPQWEIIEAALRSLDGEGRDGVCLDGVDDSYMGICGGNDGRYVVAGYLAGVGSFICESGEAGGSAMDVAVTGDFNTYASINVVTVETAIAAARAYCERGVLCEHLLWETERRSDK